MYNNTVLEDSGLAFDYVFSLRYLNNLSTTISYEDLSAYSSTHSLIHSFIHPDLASLFFFWALNNSRLNCNVFDSERLKQVSLI